MLSLSPRTLFKILFIDEQGIPMPMGTWGEISFFNQMYYLKKLKNIGSNVEKKNCGKCGEIQMI